MKDVREYAPEEVVLTFGGAVVEGWEKISVRRVHPSFSVVSGIRGKNTRIRNNNTEADIEIVLSQTSPTNYIFYKIVELDEQYGTGRIEVELKDVLTGEIFTSTEAFLQRPADALFDNDVSDRVWVMHCLSSKIIRGTGGALGSLIDKVSSIF